MGRMNRLLSLSQNLKRHTKVCVFGTNNTFKYETNEKDIFADSNIIIIIIIIIILSSFSLNNQRNIVAHAVHNNSIRIESL